MAGADDNRTGENQAGGDGAADNDNESIEGLVDRIIYTNEENGWTVLRLIEVPGHEDEVAVIGHLHGVQPGEIVRCVGEWINDPRYGEQFRAERWLAMQPSTERGILAFLGSGRIKGVGRALAKRIVARFGADTLDVLDHTPRMLLQVSGIGEKRVREIAEAWKDQRAEREVMIFLQSHGVSGSHAARIIKAWGDQAMTRVRSEPYRMADEIHGIGFRTADAIARSLGMPPDSPDRARAGARFTLQELSTNGHLYCPRRELVKHTREMLEVDDDDIVSAGIDRLVAEGAVIVEQLEDDEAIFLRSLHAAESLAAARLHDLLEAPQEPLPIDIDREIAAFEKRADYTLSDRQRDAVRKAVHEPVLVITGGPGTGKTTIITAVLHLLDPLARDVKLAAPTGRAAMRMTEATNREAKTIHRLLEYDPIENGFRRNEDEPLEADLLIVDEVSMLDQVLFASLLLAVPDGCRLILVGDVDQLPAVGAGNVLRELIQSEVVPVARLDVVFRQEGQSRIVENAHAINRGEMPAFNTQREPGDCYFIEREDDEAIIEQLASLVSKRLPEHYGLDPITDLQVLVPMRRGPLGATALNERLQEALNPNGKPVNVGGRTFRNGDKVMQIRNNYDLEVFNGDIGRITDMDEDENELVVRYPAGRAVRYDFSEASDELVPAYASTIHKSQGSEYPAVVIVLHTRHFVLLQRNLLYTAVTRAKRLVVILGTRRALRLAIENSRMQQRYTRLADRLAGRV